MADPVRYTKNYDFSAFQTANPASPLPAPRVDIEYAAIADAIRQLVAAVKDVRRSDGKLQNGVVTNESLSAALSVGFTMRGAWTAGTDYAVSDGVVDDAVFYSAKVSHTATTGTRPSLSPETWLKLFDVADIVVTGALAMPVVQFTGDGFTKTFDLGFTPVSVNNLFVKVGGVVQDVSEYTVAGSSATFATAPADGFKIEVRGFSATAETGTPASGSVTMESLSTALAAIVSGAEQSANKGVAGGYAGLNGSGKVPLSQIDASLLGAMNYQGSWNASANTPAIPAAATGNKGWYFVVNVAGATAIDGVSDWSVNDLIVSNGAVWQKIDSTDQVLSVAGLQGAISVAALRTALNYAAVALSGNYGDLAGKPLLGTAAARDVGATPDTVAAGDDSRFDRFVPVADRAALAAKALADGNLFGVTEASEQNFWLPLAGDHSAEVAAGDPRYVAPASDPTGASGAFSWLGATSNLAYYQFFSDQGMPFWKWAGRVQVGDAVNHDGRQNSVVGSWLYDTGIIPPFQMGWMEYTASLSCINSFGTGGLFASRIHPSVTSGGLSYSLLAYGITQGGDATSGCNAIYGEAVRGAGGGGALAMELDATNTQPWNGGVTNPYDWYAPNGTCAGVLLASGGGGQFSPVYDANFAFGVTNNGARWRTGIFFQDTALTGDTGGGLTGRKHAIALPKEAVIEWWFKDGGGAAQRGPVIDSWVDDNTKGVQEIIFQNDGLSFQKKTSGVRDFIFSNVASSVNGITFSPSVAGQAPSITPTGADTNIGLKLSGKGTGLVSSPSFDFTGTIVGSVGTFVGYVQVHVNGFPVMLQVYNPA